jgi:cytochrome P450
LHQYTIMRDPERWDRADDFMPERFLIDDKFSKSQCPAFIPFGAGKRSCIGDRLAVNNLFLILVRLFQSTQDYDLVLDSHQGLDPDLKNPDTVIPKEYHISFKTKIK